MLMKKLINELDHLCSVKEFTNIGSSLILRDESRNFSYEVEVQREAKNEFLVKLPLVKAIAIDTKELLKELKCEIKRKFELTETEDDVESFADVINFFSKDVAGVSSGDIKYLFLSMPHHPLKEFHDCTEQLCTLRYNSFELSIDVDQIDIALFADAPINIFYSTLLAILISSTSGLMLTNVSYSFHSCYILKENLPKISKVIEQDEELSTVKIRINKPIRDFANIDEDSIEIEVL